MVNIINCRTALQSINNAASSRPKTAATLTAAAVASIFSGSVIPMGIAAVGLGANWLIERMKFKNELTSWCNEKQGTGEYPLRITAARKIQQCYDCGSSTLNLDGSHLGRPDYTVKLTYIPPCINKLTQLKELNISYNQIENLHGLNLPNLKELNATANQLPNLEGATLPNLKNLYLAFNRFVSLESIHFPKLEKLNVVKNRLTSLALEHFHPSLRRLTAQHNPINALHISLRGLSRDCVVDIASTNLTRANLEIFRSEVHLNREQNPALGPEILADPHEPQPAEVEFQEEKKDPYEAEECIQNRAKVRDSIITRRNPLSG